MTWDTVVWTLKTTHQSLKGQGLWTPQATTKKNEDELAGLHAAINKLMAQVGARLGARSSNGGGGGGSSCSCYECGELGNLARDCPKNQTSAGLKSPILSR
jgi:hypothetical protein